MAFRPRSLTRCPHPRVKDLICLLQIRTSQKAACALKPHVHRSEGISSLGAGSLLMFRIFCLYAACLSQTNRYLFLGLLPEVPVGLAQSPPLCVLKRSSRFVVGQIGPPDPWPGLARRRALCPERLRNFRVNPLTYCLPFYLLCLSLSVCLSVCLFV